MEKRLNESDKPALVGIVPRKNLWTVIQNQRWYHIPVNSAPHNVLGVEYVAFYFPSAFGEKLKYQVIYYAPVLNIDTVKRIQLFPDEPKHPRKDENYYQFHLGEIKDLPQPIPSKRWRRIVHIPTSFQKLHSAKEINDLYDTSPLEEKMYKALKRKEINPERQWHVRLNNQNYFLDFCIFCQKANIDLECDGERYHNIPGAYTRDRLRNNQLTSFGWHVLRFSGTEIYRKQSNCLSTIEKTIHALKGLKG
ncbi:MAG: DUF559 domain-containing protein [Candidatus Zapsychrus exili]|nr:DUF559 domain-containing protein [Candidatus Zapsychrus exili]